MTSTELAPAPADVDPATDPEPAGGGGDEPTPNPVEDPAESEAFVTRSGASRGYQGLFRFTTLVIGDEYDPARGDYSEKEIDVDERDVKLLFTIEMADDSPWRFRATNLDVSVVLRSFTGDFSDVSGDTAKEQRIAINEQNEGVVQVISPDEGLEIFPGGALHKILKLQTGIFSTPDLNEPSATAGVKEFPVTISYDLEPFDNDSHGTAQLSAIFVVASD